MATGNAVDSTMVTIVNTINSIAQKDIKPMVYDQVLKANPVLYRFWKKGPRISGGPALIWPVMRDAKANAGWYTGAGQLSHGIEDTTQPAEVLWRHCYSDITIPKTDMLKAGSSHAVIDLTKFVIDQAVLSVRQQISQALFNTYPNGLDGFNVAIIDSGTYAGISHTATNSAGNYFWKPGINQDGYSGTSVARTLSDIIDFHSRATDGNESPTLGITTQAAFSYLQGQLQAQINYYPDEEMAKVGFEAFKYLNMTVVVDRNTQAGDFYFINENYAELVSLEGDDFVIDPFIPGTSSERTINSKVFWSGNLRVYSPRYHSRIDGATNW